MINDRKAESSWKEKRRKPPVIIITLIFAIAILVAGGSGLVRLILVTGQVLQGGGSLLMLAGAFGRQSAIVGLALATLLACLKRPKWGRAVSGVFAVIFTAVVGVLLAVPDAHPVFQIAPGAEQAGAYASKALIAVGIAAYAWSMVLGAKARAYFAVT